MANYTPNLNLRKPLTGEEYDVVADHNDAMDKIDAAYGSGSDTSSIKHQNVAYVETWGNDTTGTLGQIGKPYATINAALDAILPLLGGKLQIGLGTFAPMDKTKVKPGIAIIGSDRPHFNATNTALEGGTIIQGSFRIVNKHNVKMKNFGVDSGLDVCNALYGGVAQEGLIVVTDDDGSHVLIAPQKGIVVDNIITLCKDATAAVHACLIEAVDGAEVHNIETRFGMHGVVFKAFNTNASNLRTHDHGTNGVIVKCSTYARCGNVNINNIVIDAPLGTGNGLHLHDEDTAYTLDNINISNLTVKGTGYGITINSAYAINSCNFNNINLADVTIGFNMIGNIEKCTFDNIQLLGVKSIGVVMSSQFDNNSFNNMNIIGGVGGWKGMELDGIYNKFANVSISDFGTGIVCKSAGVTAHSFTNLIMFNNTIPTSGNVSTMFVDGRSEIIAPALTNGWSNFDTSNGQAGYSKGSNILTLTGLVKGGAVASVIFTLPIGFRPSKGKRVAVPTGLGMAMLHIGADGKVTYEAQTVGTMNGFLSLECTVLL